MIYINAEIEICELVDLINKKQIWYSGDLKTELVDLIYKKLREERGDHELY